MGLRAAFRAALPGIFSVAGEEATFTPASGDPVACFVFIDFDVAMQPSGMTAQVWESATVIECILSDIGREPDRGETFTMDGDVYTVQTILANDGLTVKMAVTG